LSPSIPASYKQKTALIQYLKEIKDLEPLSNEEEVGLAQRAKSGEIIRQIKTKGLQKLRHNTRSHLIQRYLK
jgi:DNA-directed RNA polymerase sigma subunit (sigma70/sigma32)|tara:strand:- start:465 stop:680 length:216 start_codon:yes stop_codon:yes gene_type:complete